MTDFSESSCVKNEQQQAPTKIASVEEGIVTTSDGAVSLSETPVNELDDSTKPATVTKTLSNQSRTKRKNRRRSKEEEKEELLNLKKERYEKLLHQAKKHLLKHAKQCRTFLVQKQIRKLKQQPSTSNDKHDNLKLLKDMTLDFVVHKALRQLGLLHANPDPNATFDILPQSSENQDIQSLETTILTHKRFQQALEEWHVKVTEFRRWTLHLDERQQQKEGGKGMVVVRNKKGKKSKEQQQQQQPTSLFCSLNDDDIPTGETMMSPYGPGAYLEDEVMVVKKNRKGQRARRAKAMAIQAKKEGKQYQSLNWRSSNEDKTKKRKRRDEEESGQKSAEQSSADHPSWSAKREQPSSIVEFKGTKITFGDDSSSNKDVSSKPTASTNDEQHPSWIAKQSQKTGIVAFQGTKITF